MSQAQYAAPAGKPLVPAPSPTLDDPTDLKRVGRLTVVTVAVTFAAILLAALLLRGPLSAVAGWVSEALGLPGIFAGVLFADSTSFPLPPDAFLLTAVAGALSPLAVLAVVSGASVLAGSVAWLLGPLLRRLPFFGRRVDAYRSQGEAFFGRYGVWAVAIAALTPLPYSIFALLAGAYRMPWKRFAVATLFRIPRFLFYLMLFRVGWHA